MYEQPEDQNHVQRLLKKGGNYKSPFTHQIILKVIIKASY